MNIITAFTAIAIVACGAALPQIHRGAVGDAGEACLAQGVYKQAEAKKLTGPARARFVKDCRGGKSSAP